MVSVVFEDRLAFDALGNVYFYGSLQGSFVTPNITVGFSALSAWVAKVTAKGRVEWVSQVGTGNGDEAKAAAVDSKGNVFLAGQTAGVFTAGSGLAPNVNAGKLDGWVAVFDSAGKRTQVSQFGTPQDDFVRSATIGKEYPFGDHRRRS